MDTEPKLTSQKDRQSRRQRDNDADAETFRELRALKAETRGMGHDRVIVLIAACILHGWNEGRRIIGALGQIGFDKKYVAIILRTNTGDDPARHLWKRNSDYTYSVHPGLGEPTPSSAVQL